MLWETIRELVRGRRERWDPEHDELIQHLRKEATEAQQRADQMRRIRERGRFYPMATYIRGTSRD